MPPEWSFSLAGPIVRIHPAESRTNFRLSEGGDDPADADLLQRLDLQLRSSVSRPRELWLNTGYVPKIGSVARTGITRT